MALALVEKIGWATFKIIVQVHHESLDAAMLPVNVKTTIMMGLKKPSRLISTNTKAWVYSHWNPRPQIHASPQAKRFNAIVRAGDIYCREEWLRSFKQCI